MGTRMDLIWSSAGTSSIIGEGERRGLPRRREASGLVPRGRRALFPVLEVLVFIRQFFLCRCSNVAERTRPAYTIVGIAYSFLAELSSGFVPVGADCGTPDGETG